MGSTKARSPRVEAPAAPKKPRHSASSMANGSKHHEHVVAGTQDTGNDPMDHVIVYCVRDDNLENASSQQRSNLENTYQMLEDAGVDPLWLSAADCLSSVSRDDPHFYVLVEFSGAVFEHSSQQQVKVVGASLVRECLVRGRSLPCWNHPVFSLSLERAVVCFTGILTEHRKHLSNLVLRMNGIVAKGFTAEVTHLVASTCVADSDKYRAARNLRVPVLSPQWIETGWQRALQCDFSDFTSPGVTQSFRLKIFTNLVISISGIGGADRVELGRLIELHGGTLSNELRRNRSTHLITDSTTSEKYRKSRQWNSAETGAGGGGRLVHIVTTRWLRKCVEEGYLVNEKYFDPAETKTGGKSSSTQKEDGLPPPVNLDCSSILGVPKHTLNSQMGNVDLNGTLGIADVAPIDRATTVTPATAPRTKLLRRESSRRFSSISNNNAAACDDVIDSLSQTLLRGDFDFLEGCQVWVCGAEDKQQDKWKRVLDRCGATRVASGDQASHVIVVKATAEMAHRLATLRKMDIEIVTQQWILDCYRDKQLLSTEAYAWSADKERCVPPAAAATPTSTSGASAAAGTASVSHVSATSTNCTSHNTRERLMGASDANPPTPLTSLRRTTTGNMSRSSRSGVGAGTSLDMEDRFNVAPTIQASIDSRVASAAAKALFQGLTFRFHGNVSGESIREWTLELTKLQAKVLPCGSAEPSDYLLTGPLEYGMMPSRDRLHYTQHATLFWTRSCIVESSLLLVDSHPLFRALPAVEGSRLMEGVVIGLLGLDPPLKASLRDLITTLGGRVEARVTSKKVDNVMPSTHIVSGTRTEVLETIRRKMPKIKIVDPSWILESIVNDKLLPEADFPANDYAFAAYAGRTDYLWQNDVTNDRTGAAAAVVSEGNITLMMGSSFDDELVMAGGAEEEEEVVEEFRHDAAPTPADSRDEELLVHAEVSGKSDSMDIQQRQSTSHSTSMTSCAASSRRKRKTSDMLANGDNVRRRLSDNPTRINPRINLADIDISRIVADIDSPLLNDSIAALSSPSMTQVGRTLAMAAGRMAEPSQPRVRIREQEERRREMELKKVEAQRKDGIVKEQQQQPEVQERMAAGQMTSKVRTVIVDEKVTLSMTAIRQTRSEQTTGAKDAQAKPTVTRSTTQRVPTSNHQQPSTICKEDPQDIALRNRDNEQLRNLLSSRREAVNAMGMNNADPTTAAAAAAAAPAGSETASNRSQTKRRRLCLEIDLNGDDNSRDGVSGDENRRREDGEGGVDDDRESITKINWKSNASFSESVTSYYASRPDEAVNTKPSITPSTPQLTKGLKQPVGQRPSTSRPSPAPAPVVAPPLLSAPTVVVKEDDPVFFPPPPPRSVPIKPPQQQQQQFSARESACSQFQAAIRSKSRGSLTLIDRSRVFLTTSMSADDMAQQRAAVESLGGVFDDQTNLKNVTHLICGKLVRGTKLMGCMASGKWVLTPEYALSCQKAGRWLDETAFEWAEPAMLREHDVISQPKSVEVAKALRRWRQNLQPDKDRMTSDRPTQIGAYAGLRLVLYVSDSKASGLVPLLEAGCAEVAVRSSLPSLAAFRPTHAIVGSSPHYNSAELLELVSLGAKVMVQDFIAKFLTDENFDEQTVYHADYKIHLAQAARRQ